MPKKFKCPICGCTEHYNIDSIGSKSFSLISYSNDLHGDVYGGIDISGNFETYICKECGHVQMFSEKLLKQLEKHNKGVDDEIKKLSNDLKIIKSKIDENQKQLLPMQKRIDELVELLKSEDITIKQQKEYKSELDKLSSENSVRRLNREIKYLNIDLEKKEKELQDLKENRI